MKTLFKLFSGCWFVFVFFATFFDRHTPSKVEFLCFVGIAIISVLEEIVEELIENVNNRY